MKEKLTCFQRSFAEEEVFPVCFSARLLEQSNVPAEPSPKPGGCSLLSVLPPGTRVFLKCVPLCSGSFRCLQYQGQK